MKDFRGDRPVNPTSTSMVIIDVRDTRLVAIGVKNLDAVQTLTCTIRRRAHQSDDMADGQFFPELDAIPPLTQRAVDVDVGVNMDIELVGIASGGGLQATVTVKSDWGRRP